MAELSQLAQPDLHKSRATVPTTPRPVAGVQITGGYGKSSAPWKPDCQATQGFMPITSPCDFVISWTAGLTLRPWPGHRARQTVRPGPAFRGHLQAERGAEEHTVSSSRRLSRRATCAHSRSGTACRPWRLRTVLRSGPSTPRFQSRRSETRSLVKCYRPTHPRLGGIVRRHPPRCDARGAIAIHRFEQILTADSDYRPWSAQRVFPRRATEGRSARNRQSISCSKELATGDGGSQGGFGIISLLGDLSDQTNSPRDRRRRQTVPRASPGVAV